MNSKLKILIPLIALILTTGCVQKTKISMKVPGEINVKGLHKIAILDFSTVKANSEKGMYAANKNLLKLAKDEVANVFYDEPFYSFSNLEIETILAKKSTVKPKSVLDGILYGKLWWKMSPEYQNIIPSKEKLETYTIRQYVCGRTKKGKSIYCSAHLTTKKEDKAFNIHYRVKNATLMMSLNLYKVSENGQLSKITEIFEVAKGKFEVKNGDYGKSISLIGAPEKLDKIKSLTAKKDKGFFGNLMSKNAKVSEKVNSDVKVANNESTIPSDYMLSKTLIDKISNELKKMIAPTRQDFEIEIEKGDTKVEKMFDYSAFNSISSYIVEEVLSKGNDEFYDGYDDLEFIDTAKEMIAYLDEKEFNQANETKKVKDVYKKIDNEELESMAIDHIKANAPMIYNYALAIEAMGGFEKSLEVYRFLFNTIDDKNQNYADGIGRALLALDMGDKVKESERNKRKSKTTNSF